MIHFAAFLHKRNRIIGIIYSVVIQWTSVYKWDLCMNDHVGWGKKNSKTFKNNEKFNAV